MSAIRPTLSEILCTEQVRLLYASLPVSLVITIISACILAIMQANILEQVPVMGWLLAILLVTATRAVLAFGYRRAAPDEAQSEIWLQRFRLGALAAGLTWGAAGWWLFTPNDIAHQAFLAIVLVGVAAGATSLSVDRAAAFSFILALLLPLIVHLLSGAHPLQLAMGFMGLLLLAVLSVNAHRLHRNIRRQPQPASGCRAARTGAARERSPLALCAQWRGRRRVGLEHADQRGIFLAALEGDARVHRRRHRLPVHGVGQPGPSR